MLIMNRILEKETSKNSQLNSNYLFVPSKWNKLVKEPMRHAYGEYYTCRHCNCNLGKSYGWHCPNCGKPIRKIKKST